jgi:hypothetical protein
MKPVTILLTRTGPVKHGIRDGNLLEDNAGALPWDEHLTTPVKIERLQALLSRPR